MGIVQGCVNRVALIYSNPSLHKWWFTILHPNFPQFMDSQTNSEPLGKILQEDTISLGGSDLDDELRENDLE